MTKFAKFRNSPRDFFADSQQIWVRKLGTTLVPVVFDNDIIMGILEDPAEALTQRKVPILHGLASLLARRAASRRRAVLATSGLPTISVIMAARNAAQTIRPALQSLVNQSYSKLEIIVVDDDSTDGTQEVVNSLADPRIRLVRNKNQLGAAMARNVGLSVASGEYLSFHDADDHSHPEKLERQLVALLAQPGSVVCVCNFRRSFSDGRRAIINGRRFAKNVISMVFPREPVLSKLGYMVDFRVGEDTEFYERIRAVFGRDRAIHLFQTLYYARFAESSLLFSTGNTRIEGERVTYDRSEEALELMDNILDRVDQIQRGELDPYVDHPMFRKGKA